MADDRGLSTWLGPEAYAALAGWSEQMGYFHVLGRAFDNGGTAARVAVVDRHHLHPHKPHTLKLVLKLDGFAGTDHTRTEYARHRQAFSASTAWAERHLAAQVDPPIPVGKGQWLVFQHVAGPLDRVEPLAALLRGALGENEMRCPAKQLGSVFGHVVHGVLADWAGPPRIVYTSVPAYLRSHLTYRLAPGKPLDTLIASNQDPAFALLRDESLTEGVDVSAPFGRAHGDLHVENALVWTRPEIEPAEYRLIDLANHEAEAPLARDPAHLVMHMVNLSLRHLGGGQLAALAEVLSDPDSGRADQLPPWLSEVIRAVHRAGEEWIEPSGFGPAWRQNLPLSLYAATLMVYVRRTVRSEDKPWLLAFARRASAQFLASVERPFPTTPTSRTQAPAPRRARPAPSPVPPGPEEKFVVGRSDEPRVFDGLFGDDALQLLNIYGPGGIGKSVVSAKLAAHAGGGGLVVGTVDVSTHEPRPSAVLRALSDSVAATTPDEKLLDAVDGYLDRLDAHDAMLTVVRLAGGQDAMFQVTGAPRHPEALAAAVDACGVALPAEMQEAVHNRYRLERYLRNAEQDLTAAFGGLLAQAGAEIGDGVGGALILDTYEEIGALDTWVRHGLLRTLPTSVKVVLLGRNRLSEQNMDWAAYTDATRTRALPELTEHEAKRYLRHYGLTDPVSLDHVHRFTGGYPLLLVLVRQLAHETGGWDAVGAMEHSGDRDRITSRLLERILREERVHEVREVLEKCAVASWVSPEIIRTVLGVGRDEARVLFESVRRHSFMERHPEGVRLHDKIRELLVERLRFTSRSEFDRIRAALVEYHAGKTDGGQGAE